MTWEYIANVKILNSKLHGTRTVYNYILIATECKHAKKREDIQHKVQILQQS